MMLTTIIATAMVVTAAPTPNDVYYYYNEYDVSSCAQPTGTPCIGEMYFTKFPKLQYVPYYVWHKIDKKNVSVWFDYNNTVPIFLGSIPCDKKQHSLAIDNNISFTQTLLDTGILEHFTFSFDITCKRKGDIITYYNINQTTYLDGELANTFPLIWFEDWEFLENEPVFNLDAQTSEPSPHPPPDTPCRYCGDDE